MFTFVSLLVAFKSPLSLPYNSTCSQVCKTVSMATFGELLILDIPEVFSPPLELFFSFFLKDASLLVPI